MEKIKKIAILVLIAIPIVLMLMYISACPLFTTLIWTYVLTLSGILYLYFDEKFKKNTEILLILDKKVQNIKKIKVDSDSGEKTELMQRIDNKVEQIQEFMNTQSQEEIKKLMNKLLFKRGGILLPQNSALHLLTNVSECDSDTDPMDEHNITTKLLLERGGVPLAREILKDDRDSRPKPSWCICQHCKHMDNKDDNVCCDKEDCITEDYHFHSICLDYYVIVLHHTQREDKDEKDENRVYRRAAYQLYALWKYGPLGKNKRRRHPSCVVSTIRYWYPAENGEYEGFKQSK